MKHLKADIQDFFKNRWFLFLLVLTAIGCYGFKLMQPVIGIDDTPYEYYFSEGLIVVVGRWVLFLLNQILNIGKFAPFLTDFAGVVLLTFAAVLWSIVWKRIFGNQIPKWGYLVFSCLFLSNPLICEVYTYFLHNGIGIGYTFSALAVLAFSEGLEEKGRTKLRDFGISALCVWIAIGCYESFAVVFLVAAFLVLLSRRLCGKKDQPVLSVLWIGGILILAILMRSLMTNLLIGVFSLEELRGEAVQRSLREMLSWITDAEGRAELTMALKRGFVMYGVFAYHYLPVFMYVCASGIAVLYSVVATIRRKDFWILLYTGAMFAASWILIFIEGKVTLYRACQFLPLFCAYAFLLLLYSLRKPLQKGTGRYRLLACVFGIVGGIAVGKQTVDMNQWFYIDYMKYESAKETMSQIALELEKNHDVSKPLVFIGTYKAPMEIIQDAYVPIGSPTFFKMKRITDLVDEHLLEKYYRGNHIWVAQTPSLSVIQWGMSAFESNAELIKFMKMHGHSFAAETDLEFIQRLAEENKEMPGWPQNGSIREEAEYILIKFGD